MTDAADWQGRVGDTWAQEWRRTDRAFAALDPHLHRAIAAAAPAARTIVDIGCGAGATSLAVAAARPEATVHGIDLSRALVAAATARGADCSNADFRVADAAAGAAAFAPADLFVSRHGVMFFSDPVAAFAALRAAAAPDAGLVFSCFAARDDNRWATAVAAAVFGAVPPAPGADVSGPFSFAEPKHVARLLAAAGWRDAKLERVDFAYRVGAGDDPVADALAFFRRIGPAAAPLRDAAPDDRAAIERRLAAMLADHVSESHIDFPAAVWLWSARA